MRQGRGESLLISLRCYWYYQGSLDMFHGRGSGDAHLRSSIGVNNGVPLKTGKTVNVTTLQGELG